MSADEEVGSEAPPTFLSEPIERYLAPLIEDLASYEASQRIPTALKEALAARYSLQEELGRGGMATVYLAFDDLLARSVAVKVMAPEIADNLRAERFTREIEITSSLQHSRIVPIQDRGEAAGVLYYVMRYVEGGSLRDRLVRSGRLPIDVAVSIARDTALALDFAHRQGVVHRDIKPENILLEGDSAFLADFGVARLIDAAGRDKLTRTGIVIGTAQYMSPEQADPGAPIDGRADIYSLACVIYEMLAGEPPFSGPTRQDVLAKQIGAKVPDLTVVRDTVTPAMQRVLEVALRKTAVDRYATAGEFVRAFHAAVADNSPAPAPVPTPPLRRRWLRRYGLWSASAAVFLLIVASLSAASGSARRLGDLLGFGSGLDTTRIAVYPFETDTTSIAAIRDRQLVGDAIRRWKGLTVVDELRTSELLAEHSRKGHAPPFRALAMELGAGRFVRGSVSAVRDSIRIHAALYDARTNRLIRDGNVRVAGTMGGLDGAVADLAVQLLFGVRDPSIRTECQKTTVPRAYTACATAHADVRQWRLAGADSGFARADTLDIQYAGVPLWLAQVRYWRGDPPARWRSAAERGYAQSAAHDNRQQIRAEALWRAARGETDLACRLWEHLVSVAPIDFTAWYSLGVCLSSDHVVLPDTRSPSGARFRSSYHRALVAYRRAFELQPSILLAFKDRLFGEVRRMFVTSAGVLRSGRAAPPDTNRFLGRAAWQGDTLAFIPFPADWVHGARAETRLATTNEAVLRQRRIFSEIAIAWLASDPLDPAAMEALGIALELLGDPGARDTLARARALSATGSDSLRLAVHDVWLRLKLSVPHDEIGIREARAKADSLLAAHSRDAAGQHALLAGLAALTGRASLAASISQQEVLQPSHRALVSAARPGGSLLAFAALGGPTDTLRALEARVSAAIESSVPAADRRFARQQWLARAATLAFPDLAAHGPGASAMGEDPLLDAQIALLRRERSVAEDYVADVRRARASVRAADLSYDGVYPEARLLVQLGDSAAAIAWIDPVLAALPYTSPLAMADAPAAGAFVRTMALRASLARRAGDSAAAGRWAKAVALLWSDADEFLRPTVHELTRTMR
jgi:serine/threonine protein kinase